MGLISKPIFSRLAKRYGIRQASSEALESGQVLVPTTNADSLLKVAKATGLKQTMTDGNLTFTVPSGKRWHVKFLGIKRENTGEITVDIYGSYELPGVDEVPLYYVASGTTHFDSVDLTLDEGTIIQTTFGTGTIGNCYFGLVYEEEDLY